MKYTMLKSLTGKHSPKYHYKIVDESGNVISERKSNRDYVAATINGQYYFGRVDLIGKGDHGKQLKREDEVGMPHNPVALLQTSNNN